MKEKIASYNSELNNIKLVVDKLVTKQNSSVFDKICKMCSDLFDKICDYDPKELNLDNIKSLIDILKRLLEICQTLKNYKDYLVGVVNQNVAELNKLKDSKVIPMPVNDDPKEVVTEVEEVKAEELDSSVTLQLTRENEKNAA